jgi:transcriptional regulator with GAF, ATPase, and Fis domain
VLLAIRSGWLGLDRGLFIQTGIIWCLLVAVAVIVSRRIGGVTRAIALREQEHRATLDQVAQLELRNALITTLAQSVDVGLAFQSLARHIARVVDCDRLGLALLKEGGQEFQTYTARVTEEERRRRPRPDIEFRIEGSLAGRAIRSGEPLLVSDLTSLVADNLDANVLHAAGFRSVMFLPLVAKGRAIGTLNVVSRAPNAFGPAHAEALSPVAKVLSVAILAQQWQISLTRFRTMEAMADVTLSAASEINGALQTIIGQCNVLEREHPENLGLQRDLATIVHQAQRIAGLLEKMRDATQRRLDEMAARVSETRVAAGLDETKVDSPQS